MRNTIVKICGLQDVEVLKSMLHLPLDFVGFVFANSRRQVTAELAKVLIEQLQDWQNETRPKSVGVFVNPDLTELAHVMEQAPLDVIQLHGQEDAVFCDEVRRRFGVKVFKVISIQGSDRENLDGVSQKMQDILDKYVGAVDAILLDTFDPIYGGGSGNTFSWEVIPQYQSWCESHGMPLMIAGGLDPSNVGELVMKYHPYGLDVSSGVESNGLKDIDKMKSFVERVKQI
ncbi:phosphoribosylanthranilate isomerase [Paenibacillus sp. CMAA1364]